MTHTQAVLISSLDLADPESGTDARRLIQQLLPEGSQVSFVPFARPDHDAYTAEAKAMLPLREVVGIHEDDEHLNHADAVFVGGGQTFRLLRALQQRHLLDAIRRRVLDDGCLYIGVSAGSVIAGTSIATTNCMPIFPLPSHTALGIAPFHINAHYIDPVPGYSGSSRRDRLIEAAAELDSTVVAPRESAWITVDSSVAHLHNHNALFVAPNSEPREIGPGRIPLEKPPASSDG